MANPGTSFTIDPNTVILLPAGESLSSDEIVSLLSNLAGNTSNNISISNFSINAGAKVEGNTSTIPVYVEQNNTAFSANQTDNQFYSSAIPASTQLTKVTSSAGQPSNQIDLNQVLTPINPNILTPDNSPIISPSYNTVPKVSKSRFLTQFDESPVYTSVANPCVAVEKPNVPVTEICNQLPLTNKDVKPFGTLVFFDLETTGLGHIIGKSNVHITEISMIALDRKEFWQSKNSELKEIRIMNKLSMCVRPRTSVSLGAAKITGLDNFNLIDQYPFDKNAATSIVSFLSRLPKPVCLLAHNGNSFDFPLLKSEFKRLSVEFPPGLLIADTLVAFRTIGIVEIPPDRKVCKSVKYGKNGRLSHSLENLHLFFFNKKPANGHTSEGDCLALAKICHKLKENALPWLEANASTLDTITPMW